MDRKPSLRARKKIRTWEAIAAAGARLFAEQGFRDTTLEQIAELADVHKQTVLRYFRNKEEIALAYQSKAYEEFSKGLVDPGRTESVLDFWQAHVQRSARRMKELGLARNRAALDQDERVRAYAVSIERQYQDIIAEALSREAGANVDTDVYSVALAAMLVGGNFAVARKILQHRRASALEPAVLSIVQLAKSILPNIAAARRTLRVGRKGQPRLATPRINP
jgi:AcrR family transcriptional regulator